MKKYLNINLIVYYNRHRPNKLYTYDLSFKNIISKALKA